MAGHGRTGWEDVAVVTVSALRHISRREKAVGGPVSMSRGELASLIGVSEYRAHAAVLRLENAGLLVREERYREDGGRLANAISVTDQGRAFLKGIE